MDDHNHRHFTMVKTREEIDQELTLAWEAEVAHDTQKAYEIYSQALTDISAYKEEAPAADQENLTSLIPFFSFLFFFFFFFFFFFSTLFFLFIVSSYLTYRII